MRVKAVEFFSAPRPEMFYYDMLAQIGRGCLLDHLDGPSVIYAKNVVVRDPHPLFAGIISPRRAISENDAGGLSFSRHTDRRDIDSPMETPATITRETGLAIVGIGACPGEEPIRSGEQRAVRRGPRDLQRFIERQGDKTFRKSHPVKAVYISRWRRCGTFWPDLPTGNRLHRRSFYSTRLGR